MKTDIYKTNTGLRSKKRRVSRMIVTLLIASLLASFATVAKSNVQAATSSQLDEKNESVYVRLDNAGAPKLIQVVNSWQAVAGDFIDRGNYSKIENLTDLKPLQLEANAVTGQISNDGTYFYQGTLKPTELPWRISLEYFLNGEAKKASDLAGQSGKFRLSMKIEPNPQSEGDFAKGLVMQITATFDGKTTTNLVTPNGTQVTQGEKILVNSMVFPNRKAEFNWSADVAQLNLEGITFAAIQMGDQFDVPQDGTWGSELNQLSAGVGKLASGVTGIHDGLAKLASGSAELNQASSNLLNGGSQLRQNAKKLGDGLNQLVDGLGKYSAGIRSASSQGTKLVKGSSDLTAGIGQMKAKTPELKQGLEALKTGIDKIITELDETTPTPTPPATPEQELIQLKQGIEAVATNLATISQGLDGTKTALDQVVTGLSAAIQGLPSTDPTSLVVPAVQTQADIFAEHAIPVADQTNPSVVKLANALVAKQNELRTVLGAYKQDATAVATIKTQISTLLTSLNTIKATQAQLITGLTALNTQFGQLKTGVVTLIDKTIAGLTDKEKLRGALQALSTGTASLVGGVDLLHGGLNQLENGSVELGTGLSAYNQAISLLSDGASGITQGATESANGFERYSKGVESFYVGVGGLVLGVTGLDSGIGALSDAITKVKGGMDQLDKQTSNIPAMVQDKFKEELAKWTGSKVKLLSFANPGAKVKSIQFLMMTDAITVAKSAVSVEPRDKTTFFDRLKRLFGLGG